VLELTKIFLLVRALSTTAQPDLPVILAMLGKLTGSLKQ